MYHHQSDLITVNISKSALQHNIKALRSITHANLFAAVVKANAYGHGLLEVAQAVSSHVDWFMVHCIDEARMLREAGFKHPILALSYIQNKDILQAINYQCQLSVSDITVAEQIGNYATQANKKAIIHIKLETGTNRLGVLASEAIELARYISEHHMLTLSGAYTHFANIEDTTDHSYAFQQLEEFNNIRTTIEKELSITIPICHTACSAAVLLFPETHLDIVRAGIAMYGLWPSKETLVSAKSNMAPLIELKPAMSIHSKVALVKQIPADAYVGYGCTYKTTRPTKLAIIPFGYFDGYSRYNSNTAHVLIHGQRAPIRGRISMNLSIVDITDIPNVQREDRVTILGKQDDEIINADQIANWCDTINYEIVTRFAPFAPRQLVE